MRRGSPSNHVSDFDASSIRLSNVRSAGKQRKPRGLRSLVKQPRRIRPRGLIGFPWGARSLATDQSLGGRQRALQRLLERPHCCQMTQCHRHSDVIRSIHFCQMPSPSPSSKYLSNTKKRLDSFSYKSYEFSRRKACLNRERNRPFPHSTTKNQSPREKQPFRPRARGGSSMSLWRSTWRCPLRRNSQA